MFAKDCQRRDGKGKSIQRLVFASTVLLLKSQLFFKGVQAAGNVCNTVRSLCSSGADAKCLLSSLLRLDGLPRVKVKRKLFTA